MTTTSAAGSDRIDAYVWRISVVVIVGSIMSILDTTIVNVALNTLCGCRWRCWPVVSASALPSCRRCRRPSRRWTAPSSPTPRHSSTCSSASAARLAPPCWRWCSSARWWAPTPISDTASAYGTAFWAATGLTVLAIVPCIILMRAERAARRARAAAVARDTMAEALAA